MATKPYTILPIMKKTFVCTFQQDLFLFASSLAILAIPSLGTPLSQIPQPKPPLGYPNSRLSMVKLFVTLLHKTSTRCEHHLSNKFVGGEESNQDLVYDY